MLASRRSANLAQTGRMVGSCDDWRQHLCVPTQIDGDFKIQETIPKVRVPRHKPAGDLVYDSKTSGIRGPRPKGIAERVVQFSPVRSWQQLTDEILQNGSVEDKINIFEKIGEGDGDRAASSVRCRSRSQTSGGCGALQHPLQLRTCPDFAQLWAEPPVEVQLAVTRLLRQLGSFFFFCG